MNKVAFLALSIDPDKLKRKLIESLYQNYESQVIKNHNFYVICQGYSQEDQEQIKAMAPEINFFFCDRIKGTISFIRRNLLNAYNIFDDYEYVVLIDDDFNFGPYAMDQYDHHIQEFSEHPEIGMIACHRRMKRDARISTSPIDTTYPQDLSAISMRNGLMIRSGILTPDEMFDDRIMYHEELYLAMQYYVRGYEVGKAWVDVYHQSRVGGLGNSLQQKYHIFDSNESDSAKKILIEEGLFYVEPGVIYYGAPNTGHVSDKAHELHKSAKEALGL